MQARALFPIAFVPAIEQVLRSPTIRTGVGVGVRGGGTKSRGTPPVTLAPAE